MDENERKRVNDAIRQVAEATLLTGENDHIRLDMVYSDEYDPAVLWEILIAMHDGTDDETLVNISECGSAAEAADIRRKELAARVAAAKEDQEPEEDRKEEPETEPNQKPEPEEKSGEAPLTVRERLRRFREDRCRKKLEQRLLRYDFKPEQLEVIRAAVGIIPYRWILRMADATIPAERMALLLNVYQNQERRLHEKK